MHSTTDLLRDVSLRLPGAPVLTMRETWRAVGKGLCVDCDRRGEPCSVHFVAAEAFDYLEACDTIAGICGESELGEHVAHLLHHVGHRIPDVNLAAVSAANAYAGRYPMHEASARAESVAVPCLTCGALAGVECITSSGRERHPHKARRMPPAEFVDSPDGFCHDGSYSY